MSLPRCLCIPLLALAALLPFCSVSAANDSDLEVVASGLDNPRGLDFSHWGGLYVTEAGSGGPCTGPVGEEICVGPTGAVTKIWHGKKRRVVEGLPSFAFPDGSEALGPQDISFGVFSAYLAVGLGGDPTTLRPALGELGPEFGQLYRISPFGRVRPAADLAAYEAEADPDGVEINSNPNSVLALPGRRFVVDAGANDLLRVGPTGRISTVAVFPPQTYPPTDPPDPPSEPEFDAVPTAVVRGPDRALYVSQLTGFPFIPDAANIYRVERNGDYEVYAGGFTNVTDLAFGPDGSLYVLEFASEGILAEPPSGGALIKVAPDGSRETIASEGLVAPTGVTVSRKGQIYVSNNGAVADDGEVVRVHTD
jgi:hypothetical protein